MLKSIFQFFIFSSLFIAFGAVVMLYQLSLLFLTVHISFAFYLFVFFSTICSYNFHWYLTQQSVNGSERLNWSVRNKSLHLILYFIGLAGAACCFVLLRQHWFWIALGTFVTFLYSAPKIPQKIFIGLRRIAVGKTLFLAFVWMYVTTLLPLLVAGLPWQKGFTWLACSRFFLIYAICILFDYRDRDDDKAAGIRSMITWLNEKNINYLFFFSLLLFVVFSLLLHTSGIGLPAIGLLLIPGLLLGALYNYSKKNFSDYHYYFVLDGLMMLSGLLMIIFYL